MKKKLNIIVLLSLIVLTLFTFGCKPQEAPLSMEDVGKWKNLESITGKETVQCINLIADNADIDWWIVTDLDGIVLESGSDYDFVDNKGKVVEGTEFASIQKGDSIWLKFKEAEDVVVWTHQKSVAPSKDVEAGTKDFRGIVNIDASQGFKVKASNYKEYVTRVGVIKLTCDETAGDGKTSWHGDYRITEVWPLRQENAEWKAVEDLKWKFDEDEVIEEGESIRLVYPEGNSVFAIKQPDRFDMENPDDKAAYDIQKDYYWCFSLSEKISVYSTKSETDKDIVGSPIKAHDLSDIKSSACAFYFTLGKLNTNKSALGTEYIIDDFFVSDAK